MSNATSKEALAFSRRYPGAVFGVGFGLMALLGVGLASVPQSPSRQEPLGIALAIFCGWVV